MRPRRRGNCYIALRGKYVTKQYSSSSSIVHAYDWRWRFRICRPREHTESSGSRSCLLEQLQTITWLWFTYQSATLRPTQKLCCRNRRFYQCQNLVPLSTRFVALTLGVPGRWSLALTSFSHESRAEAIARLVRVRAWNLQTWFAGRHDGEIMTFYYAVLLVNSPLTSR